jgi:hypothetical protein
MTLIETKTLVSAASSIEFTSIPQDGTDLYFLFALRSTKSGTDWENIELAFNGSSSNFTFRILRGTGAVASSTSGSTPFLGYMAWDGTTANTFGNGQLYIPNYAGSTNKSFSADVVYEQNAATTAWQVLNAGLWSNTAAITSVTFNHPAGGNLAIGCTISLYKITKGSDGIVTTS